MVRNTAVVAVATLMVLMLAQPVAATKFVNHESGFLAVSEPAPCNLVCPARDAGRAYDTAGGVPGSDVHVNRVSYGFTIPGSGSGTTTVDVDIKMSVMTGLEAIHVRLCQINSAGTLNCGSSIGGIDAVITDDQRWTRNLEPGNTGKWILILTLDEGAMAHFVADVWS